MTTEPDRPPTRKLRLAVVMNGGVSLAVWMSGATYELNSCRIPTTPAGEPSSSRTAWQKILAKASTTISIDLVAGASAGGLNGTVLARAIAIGRDLPDMRPLWFEQAALGAEKLLGDDKWSLAASLLDGDYLLEKVGDLLETKGAEPAQPAAEQPTVTLLVTATALPIAETAWEIPEPVRDSRRIYRFISRPGVAAGALDVVELPPVSDRNDFVDVPTLALAARASASFPAAFQPVEESPALKARRISSPGAKGRWLMDGGVLDNAPFEPMLAELRRRAVSDDFERIVLYVNPSPPPVKPKKFLGEQPGILRTLAAFLSATREPDRRLDTEGLLDALEAARYTVTDPDQVLATAFHDGAAAPLPIAALHPAATALLGRYQQSRRQALNAMASTAPNLGGPVAPPFAGLLVEPPPELMPSSCELPAQAGWDWGLGAAGRVLRWWGRALNRERGPSEQSRRKAFRALAPAQRLVQAWGDEFDAAVTPHRGDVEWWFGAAQGFLTSRQLLVRTAQLMRAAADQIAPALGAASGTELLHASLDLEVINRAMSWRSDSTTDVPAFTYWQITPDAARPFNLGKASANDSDWPSKKLYGERWGHFGAFASEDGRRWDWLWGRLDAATTLSRKILSAANVPEAEIQRLQDALVHAILREEDWSQDRVKDRAEKMLELRQSTLWHDYVTAASASTRASLQRVAADLLGTLVPESWPQRVHAMVDTPELWRRHGPGKAVERRRLVLYRALGLGAQKVAAVKVKGLLTQELETSTAAEASVGESAEPSPQAS